MKTKLINDERQKTYVLVLDKGDEAVSSIEGFASENGIAAAQLTGIGACSGAVLGFFDWETKDYRKIPVTEQVEVGRSWCLPSLQLCLHVKPCAGPSGEPTFTLKLKRFVHSPSMAWQPRDQKPAASRPQALHLGDNLFRVRMVKHVAPRSMTSSVLCRTSPCSRIGRGSMWTILSRRPAMIATGMVVLGSAR